MRPGLALAALALAAGCTSTPGPAPAPPPATTPAPSSGGPPASTSPVQATPISPAASAPPLDRTPGTYNRVTGTVSPVNTGRPPGPCRLRGTGPASWLPDLACTPGGADPAITEATLDANLCVPKTLQTQHGPVTLYVLGQHWLDGRPPSSQTTAFKRHVAAPAYGLPAGVDGELDHDVARQLGGSNAGANLWIEPGPIPNPKDAVENRLHDWMCAAPTRAQRWGRLQGAQQAIAADWITAEDVLGVPARIGHR